MSMEKEWKELRQRVKSLADTEFNTVQDCIKAGIPGCDAAVMADIKRGPFDTVIEIMDIIERRSLPEKVAVLLKNLASDSKLYGNAWSIIADATKALETGDMSDLESWGRQK